MATRTPVRELQVERHPLRDVSDVHSSRRGGRIGGHTARSLRGHATARCGIRSTTTSAASSRGFVRRRLRRRAGNGASRSGVDSSEPGAGAALSRLHARAGGLAPRQGVSPPLISLFEYELLLPGPYGVCSPEAALHASPWTHRGGHRPGIAPRSQQSGMLGPRAAARSPRVIRYPYDQDRPLWRFHNHVEIGCALVDLSDAGRRDGLTCFRQRLRRSAKHLRGGRDRPLHVAIDDLIAFARCRARPTSGRAAHSRPLHIRKR